MQPLNGQSSFQSLPQGGDNGTLAPRLLPSPPLAATEKEGFLEASILSVYDLPFTEPPVAVTLSIGETTVSCGPPVARHKDRNSFRFSSKPTTISSGDSSTSINSNHEAKVVAPLRELYKSKVAIQVVYGNKTQNLETTYELRQLRVHESKWLILNLSKMGDSEALATSSADDDDDIQPTIRLKLQLSGPYRSEIAALVGLCQVWFGLIDHVGDNAAQVWKTVPKVPLEFSKFILLPAVPIVATLVVASPVLAGLAMVGLPFFLPFVLMAVSVVAGLMITGGIVYSSTKHGRKHIGGTMAPFLESLLSSRAGQTLVYDTGPRPTPVGVAKHILPKELWSKLVVSLLIDLIGSSSYLLPIVGEGCDVAWAPIQTIMVMAMYDPTTPNLKYISFAEEILPFTDVVPTATIGWALEFVPQMLGKNPDIAGLMNIISPTNSM